MSTYCLLLLIEILSRLFCGRVDFLKLESEPPPPPRRTVPATEQVQGTGYRVQGSGFRVQGTGFRVQGSGFRVQGSGFPPHRHRYRAGGYFISQSVFIN